MTPKIKIWLWVFAWILLTLIGIYFIWKNEENKKIEMLWISQEQAQEIKSDVETLNKKYSTDSVTNEEQEYLTMNWVKKDSNWLFYTYDKYQLDSKMIYFKKEDWNWKWSILLWNWDNLWDDKYDNSNSIYNWYQIKQNKNKEIFNKLREFSK